MNKVEIKVQRVTGSFDDLPLPEYATEGSSGLDLRASVGAEMIIEKGKFGLVPTNIRVEIPAGYDIQVRPRSGLAAKSGIGVLNSPGTVDSDYRGEIKVILFNFGQENFVINRGDRIAQMVVTKIYKADMRETFHLNDSNRGDGGFGHTGTK